MTIDHGGGWVSYYAHLKRMAVKASETVLRGQAIGALGNTSQTNPGISPHLHYEVRLGTGYPGNIQRAVFNGSTFPYPAATLTSKNCATQYDPQALCGSGFEPNDSRALGSLGTVNLTWNDATSQNCVTTLKFTNTGTQTFVKAYLKPAGATQVTDQGSYFSYAGPVKKAAPSCITWGGTIGSTAYNSPSEHC